jgi:hypothetical protein
VLSARLCGQHRVAYGLLGVAEVAECLGLLVAVAEFQVDIKGPLLKSA